LQYICTMAIILHIETATKVCSVAISRDGELLGYKENEGLDFSHGEELTNYIDEVVRHSELQFSDLNAVSISSGPGSYTGLRIGAATAKGLCFALNIPLIAIDSLTALASLAKDKFPGYNIAPVIDARRMEVYNQIFDQNMKPLKPISADIIDEKSYEEYEPFVILGDGMEKLQSIWEGRDILFEDKIVSSARGQVDLAFEAFKQSDFVDTAYWEPFYLKDFVAGVKKKVS